MSQLAQLLRYLDREDITEVVLQTGKAPAVRIGAEYRPLGRTPVTTAHVEAIVSGTPLAALVPAGDGGSAPQTVVLFDRPYNVRLARRGPALQLRIEQPGGSGLPDRPSENPPGLELPPRPPQGSRPTVEPLEGLLPPPQKPGAPPLRPPMGRATQPVRPDAHRAVTRPVTPSEELDTMILAAQQRGVVVNHLPEPSAPEPLTVDAGKPKPPPAPVKRPDVAFHEMKPGPELFRAIIAEARARKASDVHVIADRPVLIRTAGELSPCGGAVAKAAVEATLLPLLSAEQKKALDERGYADLALEVEGQGRLRANVSRQKSGLKGSFRLVVSPVPTLDSLGLPKDLAKVTTYHQGLVVIAGPNGHGKTTTLAALVDTVNASRPHHILMVEDPIEFIHARKKAFVSQREVGTHTRSFATALKAALREDPDVIVIGELRDRETVEIALTAAETGHLVLATMSTPSAGKTIDRLIDLFPPADQSQVRATLAGALKFIVAQRLLPSASGTEFVAVAELLTGNPALWALIRDNKLFQLPSLQQRGRAFGMIRFDDSLVELVRAGKIHEDEALRAAENKKEFMNLLRPPVAAAPAQPAGPSALQSATDAAGKGLSDIKSRMGGLFGKKE